MAKDMDNVVEFIRGYDNAQYILFKTKVKRFEPVRIKKLLFQMIAWSFLKVAFDKKLEIVVFELATKEDRPSDLAIDDDDAWEYITETNL